MDQTLPQRIAAALDKVRLGVPSPNDFNECLRQPSLTELSSWECWVLVALLRHERRQQWVGHIVESKLRGSGRELGTAGAFAHPEDIEQSGYVPGEPEWKYYFHGRGCCLTHSDGTSIDVDFADDGSPLQIDPYFFSAFLSSAPRSEWIEGQLRRPVPFLNIWQYELNRLVQLGLIERKWRFWLSPSGRELAEWFEPLVDEVNRLAAHPSMESRTKMSWLLVRIGDFISAKKIPASASSDFDQHLSNKALEQVNERVRKLRASLAAPDKGHRELALAALANLGRDYSEKNILSEFEQRPPTAVHFLCLDIMDTWDNRRLEPLLISALKRFAPPPSIFRRIFQITISEKDEVERPRNGLVVAISKRLLKMHTPSTIPSNAKALVLNALGTDRKACDAEAGFLLYLLSPAVGLKRIVDNCHNRIPITRQEAALFLSMIGTAESIDALIAIAEGSPEQGGHEAACALAQSDNPRAQDIAKSWSLRNDGYEEAEGHEIDFNGRKKRVWKMDEIMRSNLRDSMKWDSERLNREYAPLLAVWRAG